MQKHLYRSHSGLTIVTSTLALIILWPGLLQNLLASSGFMPHGHCYLWKPGLVWLHLTSDILIGLSYVAISFTLACLVNKARQDIPFDWVFIAFGLFIIACGTTHFMEVWTLWTPTYWLAGQIKLITAVASVTTAVALPPLVPQVLSLIKSAKLSQERKLKLETANKELEQLYEKLKELDQLKTQFFATVSHELRTPLTLIIGQTESLIANRDLNEKQQHKLEVVRSNANSLLKHVNDLLDISKLEADKMGINYAQVDLAPIVRMTAANFDTIAQQNEISFSVDTPESLPAQIDPEKLQRVLLNLLANAFKFTPTGGSIRCTLKKLEDEGAKRAREAGEAEGENIIPDTRHPTPDTPSFAITVEDSGCGVAPELREIIFEPFRQGEIGSNRSFGGTGLGLAIAKDFVELHGGMIAVEDAPLGGASFSLQIPLMAPTGTKLENVVAVSSNAEEITSQLLQELKTSQKLEYSFTHAASDSSTPLVLVIEDHPEMRHYITEVLATKYRVVTASNGKEGLAKALALHPELIVSDVMMPQMSGEQLLAQINQHPELDEIPIVFLTAKADEHTKLQLLHQGAQDYLTKPFKAEELQIRVSNLMAMKGARKVLQQELNSKNQDLATLAKELAARKQELQKLALELESKVQERTAELAEANAFLRTEIVAREMAQAELERSLSLLRATLESTADGILVVDLTGKIVSYNQKFLDLWRIPKLVIEARSDRELIEFVVNQLKDPEDFLTKIAQIYNQTDVETYYDIIHFKDGRIFERYSLPQLIEGESVGRVISFRDLTKRQQTEERLRLLESVVVHANDAIIITEAEPIDEPGPRIIYVNEAFTQMTGYSEAEVLGKTPRILQGRNSDRAALAKIRSAMKNWQPVLVELINCRKDGSEFWVELSLVPIADSSGCYTHWIAIERDITERKQAEEKIHALNADLEKRVIQRTAQLEATNQELAQANRMKDEFLAIVSHELRTPLNAILGWSNLLRTRRFDATTTAKALETIERNAKSQTQLIDDLLDVSRMMRGKFHLQLSTVDLCLTIQAAIESALPTAQAKSIDLQFLIENEFKAENAQLGRKDLELGHGNTDKNIVTASPRLPISASFKTIPSFIVTGDANRLQQVVWNLLSNAIKFTPEGGSIEVRLSVIEGTRNREQGTGNGQQLTDTLHPIPYTRYAQIQVIDTGSGISSEFLPYVFDQFRQADASITRAHGGLGLGLAIVRQVIDLHRGNVYAESPGKGMGATFTVQLPLLESDEQVKGGEKQSLLSPLASQLKPLRDLRILVVNSEAYTRNFIVTTLERYGAQVQNTTSTQQALEILEQSVLDVLVCDLSMHGEDGYSLIRQVRSWDNRARQIPAIALLAPTRADDRSDAIAAGFQKCLSKPVQANQLLAAITVLSGRINQL